MEITQEPLLTLKRKYTVKERNHLLRRKVQKLKDRNENLKNKFQDLQFKIGELTSEVAELQDTIQKFSRMTEKEKEKSKNDEYVRALLQQIKTLGADKRLDRMWEARYYALLGSQLNKAC